MNEMNELENQLRSWAPRRPSPKLEQRLFARRPARADEQRKTPHMSFAWLVPASAALMLVCLVFNQRNSTALASSGSGRLVAVILSNQSAAAYLPGSFHGEQNLLTADTFEWTNGSRSTSSISSLSSARGTN
jgi:hypothetical protein